MPLTWYGRDLKLGVLIGEKTFPTTLYVALLWSSPQPDCTGLTIRDMEPVYEASYARAPINMVIDEWVYPSVQGVITNKNELAFPTPATSWGTLTAYALATDSQEGQVFGYGVLTSPVVPVLGQPFVVPPGQLRIREL